MQKDAIAAVIRDDELKISTRLVFIELLVSVARERLPLTVSHSPREICAALGFTPKTVIVAISELEAGGYIIAKPGPGCQQWSYTLTGITARLKRSALRKAGRPSQQAAQARLERKAGKTLAEIFAEEDSTSGGASSGETFALDDPSQTPTSCG
jgi:DNA-binding transcriptional MocR family regulator